MDLFSEELDPHRLMTVMTATLYDIICEHFQEVVTAFLTRTFHETFSYCQERQTIGHFSKANKPFYWIKL